MRLIKFSNVFLVNTKNKILVLRRTAEHPTRPLALDLPGGGLEEGENFEQAAIREVNEETGLVVGLNNLKLIRHKRYNLPERNLEGAVYRVKIPSKDIPITLSDEHDAYYWITPSQLKGLPEFHQESVEHALKLKDLN